jgi:NADPH:quinone reductase-like Zn-dependent oxidoreductase
VIDSRLEHGIRSNAREYPKLVLPKYQTRDMLAQHELLSSIAKMVDEGGIRTTLGEHMGTITATNLKTAHAALESGRTKEKIVLTGF